MACDWRDLPHQEIWAVDSEFYPGRGLANSGREGDRPTPLCLCAIELRSGRVVELWQDELGSEPPYRLDRDALFVSYVASAEFGVHLAQGWVPPACAVDAYVEFRHLTNDGRVRSGDREKGFYSLAGALRYFKEDALDVEYKQEMRDRILAGPPFTAGERRQIQQYCREDTEALARLIHHIVPTIRSLPHAYQRAAFMWVTAVQERRGVPLEVPLLNRIRGRWNDMQVDLVREIDRPFGCFEIVDGQAHWREERFAAFVARHRLPWPTHPSGKLDTTAETFKDMARARPLLEPLRELRSTLSKLRLNDLQVGTDGRARTPLWPFGTKTARNAPSNSKYIFGPSKWIRFLIAPEPDMALVHRDYQQEEMWIAAVLSGDGELLKACASGDVYLGIAKMLGLAPADATAATHPDLRNQFKTVVLAISYGLGARSLAQRTGLSLFEAAEILARIRARFRALEAFMTRNADQAGLQLELSTCFDWRMRCPPGINARTVRNFPIQATGSEVLHVACLLAERRGLAIVAPIHDAFLVEAPAADIEDISVALDQCMRDAARIVLRGVELPTSAAIIRPGERYHDDRGLRMWQVVTRLMAKLETAA
jgi:hypothetical protein